MKKIKLLLLPLIAFSLASCGEDAEQGSPIESGTIQDLIPEEFNFGEFTRQGVLDTIAEIQKNTGFTISFKASTYEDVNSEPTYVTNVTVGGKEGYTWAIETTNGVTKGAAIKVEGSSYVTYLFEDNAWRVYNFGDYEGYQVADEASNYVNEKVNELVLKEDYLNKIDFTASTGSTSICSRSCYTFSYSGDYYLSVAIDKVLGVTMSISATYVDAAKGTAYRECVEVESFAVTNIEIPAFPAI